MKIIRYGSDEPQFAQLHQPSSKGPHPVIVTIHGGFWRAQYDLHYLEPFCREFMQLGVAMLNVEYRRIGHRDGGWPGTFEDIMRCAERLRDIANENALDLERVIALGHSAGGHLALWLGAQSPIKLRGVAALAGLSDLRRAADLKLSNRAVEELLGGGPATVPERYQFASPIERLPFGVSQRLLHGEFDADVPYDMSVRYVVKAKELGDDAELITLHGAGHFDLIKPGTKEFGIVVNQATALLNHKIE